MGSSLPMAYPVALAVTLLVEVPLWVAALLGLRLARPTKAAALAIAVNLTTHPALWFCLSFLKAQLGTQIGLEILVCLTEWALLLLFLRRDAALLAVLSVGVNAASYLTGFVV